jgi:hypothetical protein
MFGSKQHLVARQSVWIREQYAGGAVVGAGVVLLSEAVDVLSEAAGVGAGVVVLLEAVDVLSEAADVVCAGEVVVVAFCQIHANLLPRSYSCGVSEAGKRTSLMVPEWPRCSKNKTTEAANTAAAQAPRLLGIGVCWPKDSLWRSGHRSL